MLTGFNHYSKMNLILMDQCFVQAFQSGAFVVIRVQITEVNKEKLVFAAKGQQFATSFNNLLTSLVALGLEEKAIPALDEKILAKAHEGMMAKFAEILPIKMAEAGLVVEVTVCPSEEQAEFFFATVNKLKV